MSTQRRSDSDQGGIRLASDGWRDELDLFITGGHGAHGTLAAPGAWIDQFLTGRFFSFMDDPAFEWLFQSFSSRPWMRAERARALDALPLLLSEQGVLQRLAAYRDMEMGAALRRTQVRPGSVISPVGGIQPVPVPGYAMVNWDGAVRAWTTGHGPTRSRRSSARGRANRPPPSRRVCWRVRWPASPA